MGHRAAAAAAAVGSNRRRRCSIPRGERARAPTLRESPAFLSFLLKLLLLVAPREGAFCDLSQT